MRFLWLPFCCILAGATHAQADSYRDRDEGFNPMNMMQGMPNPMGMFDSSERDDYSRHRPPPPPRMAPGYPYPAPPGYAAPPVPRAPYYATPNTQPTPQEIPQSSAPAPAQTDVGSSRPAEAPSYGMAPPPADASQGPSPVMPEAAQPAYSFRPMTPPEQSPATAPMTAVQPGVDNPTPSSEHFPEVPASGQTVITPPYPEQETPMVNGQPAVFRPMGLGADSPPTQ